VNPRATLALLIVTLLAVGLLVYLRQTVDPTREAAETRRYAAIFDPAALDEFDLTRGNETLSFRQVLGGWRLIAPVEDRADPAAVDRLLGAARFLAVRDRQRTRDPAAVPESGLATPRVRLDLRGPRTVRLDFGSATALPGEIFARLGGQPELLRVPDSILELATATASDFRDPRLTDLVPEDIERFTVRRADGEMTLRLERGRWFIDKPVRAAADPRAIRDFLERLLGLRITDFQPPAATTAPDALPGQVAQLALTPRGGGEEIHLELLRETTPDRITARYAPRGGALTVDPAALLLFDVSPEELRDRSLGYVEPDAIDRIVLSVAGKTTTLVRLEDDWMVHEDDQPVEAARVDAIVEAFNTLQVAGFGTAASPRETGLDEPAIRLRFFAWLSENTPEEPAGGHLVAAADFGWATPEGDVFARTGEDGETVIIPSELPELLEDLLGLSGPTGPPAPAATPELETDPSETPGEDEAPEPEDI